MITIMKRIIALIIVLALSAAAGLFAFFSLKTDLPKGRPENLTIGYSLSGGMLPTYSTIFISKRESYSHSRGADGKETKKSFTVSDAELDALYEIFRKERFDKIRIIEVPMMYDGVGVNAYISWDGVTHSKGNWAGHDVKPSDMERFERVTNAIGELARKKIAELEK